jgi:hypothetical protein
LFFRFFRFLTFSVSIVLLAAVAQAADEPDDQAQPATQAPAAQTPRPAPAPGKPVPDYPDPRTFTFGLSFFAPQTNLGTQPSLYGGSQAPDYESMPNLGQPKNAPGVFISFPITRTGELKFDGSLIKGTASSYATVATDPFDQGVSYNPGDYLAKQYQIKHIKLYLDDLFFPHKFPVAKLRFKTIWGIEWNSVKENINSPLAASPVTAENTNNIVTPVFGMAMEYAIAKHVLFRLQADGFAFPHKMVQTGAEGEISFRTGSFELVGGEQYMHIKSSPNADDYVSATFIGAFVSARWHFENLF